MKKLRVAAIALILFTAGRAYGYENGDFQIWNTDAEEFNIVKDFKLALEEEFRWGADASEFYYQHYDAGLFYASNKYLSFGGGYRQIYEFSKGKFKPEYAPYVTATLFLEFRNFDHKADFWRYRNKATIKMPWKFTKLEIRPYISDEIFIVFGGVPGDLNQNRFSAGLEIKLVKNIKADIYYMLQSSKGSVTWTNANVLGTKLKLVL
jgi:hypothetical protein